MNRFFLTVILAGMWAGCDLFQPEEKPKGTSTMSASINGTRKSFSNVWAIFDIDGFKAFGYSKTDTISLLLANGSAGTYTWKRYTLGNWGDTAAFINSIPALPDVGGFTLSEHDSALSKIDGIFYFTAVDSFSNDTIHVTNGSFTLYWIGGDG